jgi:DNA-binding MarR family transcriptional regulator
MPRKTHDEPVTASETLDTSYLQTLLGYNARRAALVTIERFLERMKPLGLRPVEFSVMSVVRHNPGVTSRQVCAALGIQPSNFVPLLASLEKREWVQREPHPNDGRAISLRLTPTGEKMMTHAEQMVSELEDEIVKPLKASEHKQLLNLLRKIYAS